MAANPSTAVVPLRRALLARAPFGEWTYRDAAEAVAALQPENYDQLRAIAEERDLWRNGAEWVGPGAPGTNEKIGAQYAPDDVVGEVLDNVGNAFSEPQIGAAPLEMPGEGAEIPPEVQARMDEAVSLLSAWWDRQRMQEHILSRLRTSAWAGRAPLRLWVPGRFMEKATDGSVSTLPAADVAAALEYIHVSAPEPSACAVVTDPATQAVCAVFLGEESVPGAEGRAEARKRADLLYLDPDAEPGEEAETVLRVVYADEGREGYETRLPLGGRLLVSEMQTPALLTDPVLRTQRQLGLLCSLLTRIGETAAFRERYIRNAKPFGRRSIYTEGQPLPAGAFLERDETGRDWIVEPEQRTLGANTTTELVGLEEERRTQAGVEMARATPAVDVFDPVDPTPYIHAAEAVRARILRMCKQGHLAIASAAQLSGVAYEQARAAFAKDLNRRRVAEEGMLRETLEAALALAEVIAEKEGYFTSVLRVTVDQHVDAGPRSPDAVRLDMDAYQAGLLSRETVMARLSVEDVVAEVERIRQSAAHILGVLDKAAAAATTFSAEGVLRALVEARMIPEELADAVLARDTDGATEL